MKRYVANRQVNGTTVIVRDDDSCQSSRRLVFRLDLANHSPEGFEWGNGGSGPAQLALAILADHLNDDQRALTLYPLFIWTAIAELPSNQWSISAEEIDQFLADVVAGEDETINA